MRRKGPGISDAISTIAYSPPSSQFRTCHVHAHLKFFKLSHRFVYVYCTKNPCQFICHDRGIFMSHHWAQLWLLYGDIVCSSMCSWSYITEQWCLLCFQSVKLSRWRSRRPPFDDTHYRCFGMGAINRASLGACQETTRVSNAYLLPAREHSFCRFKIGF